MEADTFYIKYKNKDIKVHKKEAEFSHGYAIVRTTIQSFERNDDNTYHTHGIELLGVVDENYKTVFPFGGWGKNIRLFPEGNIIIEAEFHEIIDEQELVKYVVEHYKIKKNKFYLIKHIQGTGYEIVDESIIAIDTLNGFKEFYDVKNGYLYPYNAKQKKLTIIS